MYRPREPVLPPQVEEYLEHLARGGGERPKPEAFASVYGDAAVRRDNEWVLRQREKHATDIEENEWNEVLECLLSDVAHQGVFGDSVNASRTSEFDDYAHHGDLVFEKNGAKILIDATTTERRDVLAEKLSHGSEEAKRGDLARLKYFGNPKELNPKEGYGPLPRVILRVGMKEIAEVVTILQKVQNGEVPQVTLKDQPLWERLKNAIRDQLAELERLLPEKPTLGMSSKRLYEAKKAIEDARREFALS